jgi:hypothetical protein
MSVFRATGIRLSELDRYIRARARHAQAWRPHLWLGVNNRGPLGPPHLRPHHERYPMTTTPT